MKVTLLNYTPHPEATIAIAAKLCYSNKSIQDLTLKASDDDAAEFIDRLMSLGHESPIEHVTFTFGIEGISYIRHRRYQSRKFSSVGPSQNSIILTEVSEICKREPVRVCNTTQHREHRFCQR